MSSILNPVPGVPLSILIVAALISSTTPSSALASTCYGTISNGRLDGGLQLPAKGANFSAYSPLGVQLGRTYVHETVKTVLLESYKALEQAAPTRIFVYGETGLVTGGPMPPHRTHEAGLSVDFMVPVWNATGTSVPLPATAANQFGYGIEFDAVGRAGNMRIDFEAAAEHLYQLALAAQKEGISIGRVIFDPALMPLLFDTRRGLYLKKTLPFMKERPWIRHDEHYHVDFKIPCRPLRERSASRR